jgi:hypothetical protein
LDKELRVSGALPPETGQRLRARAREQRSLADGALAIASTIEGLLQEMQNNRIGEAADLERLGHKVVEPLRALANGDLPQLGDGLDGLRGEPEAAARSAAAIELADGFERAIERMESVLQSMVKLEGYTEIIHRLRVIIEIQDQSSAGVRAAYEKLTESLFSDGDEGESAEGAGGGKGGKGEDKPDAKLEE